MPTIFAHDIFRCIFMNENIQISLKVFVPEVPINNIPALVQIVTWRWPGNKPLSEPMIYASLSLNELKFAENATLWLCAMMYLNEILF